MVRLRFAPWWPLPGERTRQEERGRGDSSGAASPPAPCPRGDRVPGFWPSSPANRDRLLRNRCSIAPASPDGAGMLLACTGVLPAAMLQPQWHADRV